MFLLCYFMQKEAGWIGFYATVSGCVFSLIVARYIRYCHHVFFLFCLVLDALCHVLLYLQRERERERERERKRERDIV